MSRPTIEERERAAVRYADRCLIESPWLIDFDAARLASRAFGLPVEWSGVGVVLPAASAPSRSKK